MENKPQQKPQPVQYQMSDLTTCLFSEQAKARRRISQETHVEQLQSLDELEPHRDGLNKEERMQHDFKHALHYSTKSIERYLEWCDRYEEDQNNGGC